MLGRSATPQDAADVMLDIKQNLMEAEGRFLAIGVLLKRARDERHWQVLEMESFQIYIDELDLPWGYKHCISLIGIVEHIASLPFVTDEAMEYLGVSKLIRLLPAAREGKLTKEDWEFSKVHSDMIVRDYVGHSTDRQVSCPNCGHSFPIPKRKEK